MSTSTHPVAVFKEGFALVEVDPEDVELFGEAELWEMFQNSEWFETNDLDAVIIYWVDEDNAQLYGEEELVREIEQMDFDQVTWDHEITMEWDDEDDTAA